MKKMQKAGIVMLSVVVLGGVAPAVAPSVLNLNGSVVYAAEETHKVTIYYNLYDDPMSPFSSSSSSKVFYVTPNQPLSDHIPETLPGGYVFAGAVVNRGGSEGTSLDSRNDLFGDWTNFYVTYPKSNRSGANNNAGTEVKPNNDGNANAGANNNAGTEVKPNNDGNANAGANNNASTEVKPNNDGNANAGANNNASTEVKPNNDGNANAGANNDTGKAQVSNQQAKKGSSTVASASGKVEAKKASNTAAGSDLPMLLAMVGSVLALFSTLFKKSTKEE